MRAPQETSVLTQSFTPVPRLCVPTTSAPASRLREQEPLNKPPQSTFVCCAPPEEQITRPSLINSPLDDRLQGSYLDQCLQQSLRKHDEVGQVFFLRTQNFWADDFFFS